MAMYLRTVRSPVPQAGAFAIRKPVASGPQNHELHSNTTVDTIQEARSEESDYEQDSFCVNSDSVEFLSSPSEVDIQRQEYFKSPTSKPKIERAPKRKRIFVLNDTSSSEEETSHNAAMDSTGLSHSLLAVCSASTLESKQEQLFETCNEPLKTTSSSSSHSVSPQKVPISFKVSVSLLTLLLQLTLHFISAL